MTVTGTSHFESFDAARKYYAAYGFSGKDVLRKLAEEEIHIGPPSVPRAGKLLLDADGRYYIQGEQA